MHGHAAANMAIVAAGNRIVKERVGEEICVAVVDLENVAKLRAVIPRIAAARSSGRFAEA